MAQGNGKTTPDDDLTLFIGETLYDLRPLLDPPIGLWEVLERLNLLDEKGNVHVKGVAEGFDFLHCALCATHGAEGVEGLLNGTPPLPRSVVTGIPGSKFPDVVARVGAVFGRNTGDATRIRPTPRPSSTTRTSSRGRTGGRSVTSEH